MLNGIRSVQDALGDIEAALTMRRDDQKRIDTEIATLEAAATALRAIAPVHAERPVASPRRVERPRTAQPSPPSGAPELAAAGVRYPEAQARRARVLKALPLINDVRCAELARTLDIAQCHVQNDLEALAASGLAERTGHGRWKRTAEEVVVWSGRDSLLPPASEATRQSA